jgi:NTP pyrophosphatase (non-canonical NTP hydrolase)
MSVDAIKLWHSRARPEPTDEQFQAQLACHIEEMGEMIEELDSDDDLLAYLLMKVRYDLSNITKAIRQRGATAYIKDRENFLREMTDQIVTSVGVCHTAKMDIVEAVSRINTANWSKYDHEGNPIFDESGKIVKGPNYVKATLKGCYE